MYFKVQLQTTKVYSILLQINHCFPFTFSFNFLCFPWLYILHQKLNQASWMRLLLMSNYWCQFSFQKKKNFFCLAPYVIPSLEVSAKPVTGHFFKQYCLRGYHVKIKSIRKISTIRPFICCKAFKPCYYKINGYIEEINGTKYLTLVPTDKSHSKLKSTKNYWAKSKILLDQ